MRQSNKFSAVKNKSLIYALIAVLFWSTVATAFKLTLRGMTSSQLLFYSSFVSALVLYFIAIKESPVQLKRVFDKTELKRNIFLGLINPFIYYLILFKSYSLLPAQEAQPINLTWPIIFSVLSSIFLNQKISLRILFGMLISFLGVVVIAAHGDLLGFKFKNIIGVLLALLSSFVWAVFWIINLRDKRTESVKLFGSFSCGTIFTGIYILFFDSFDLFQIKYLFGAVYIGLFEMGITFFIWSKALALSEDKAKTSTIIYLFPVISMFLIVFVLGEKLLVSSIIGLVLIIGGILFQQLYGRIRKNV